LPEDQKLKPLALLPVDRDTFRTSIPGPETLNDRTKLLLSEASVMQEHAASKMDTDEAGFKKYQSNLEQWRQIHLGMLAALVTAAMMGCVALGISFAHALKEHAPEKALCCVSRQNPLSVDQLHGPPRECPGSSCGPDLTVSRTQPEINQIWRNTAYVWAVIRQRESLIHLQELQEQQDHLQEKARFRRAVLDTLVHHKAAIAFYLLFLLGIELLSLYLDRLLRPKPFLPLAAAIAATIARYGTAVPDDPPAQTDEKDPCPKSPATHLPWSHEALSPRLLEALARDERFTKLHADHMNFNALVRTVQFRYLVLSIADGQRFWRNSLRRYVAQFGGYIHPNGSTSSHPEGAAASLGTLALLLAAASVIPTVGQYMNSSRIESQLEKQTTQTTSLVERYLPSPTQTAATSQTPPPIVTSVSAASVPASSQAQSAAQVDAARDEKQIPPVTINNNSAAEPPKDAVAPPPIAHASVSASIAQATFTRSKLGTYDPQYVTIYYRGDQKSCRFKLTLPDSDAKDPWPPLEVKISLTVDPSAENCPSGSEDLFVTNTPAYNAFLNADVSIDKLMHKNILHFREKRAIVIDINPRDRQM
jgi:hypothetical protein